VTDEEPPSLLELIQREGNNVEGDGGVPLSESLSKEFKFCCQMAHEVAKHVNVQRQSHRRISREDLEGVIMRDVEYFSITPRFLPGVYRLLAMKLSDEEREALSTMRGGAKAKEAIRTWINAFFAKFGFATNNNNG